MRGVIQSDSRYAEVRGDLLEDIAARPAAAHDRDAGSHGFPLAHGEQVGHWRAMRGVANKTFATRPRRCGQSGEPAVRVNVRATDVRIRTGGIPTSPSGTIEASPTKTRNDPIPSRLGHRSLRRTRSPTSFVVLTNEGLPNKATVGIP